MITIQRLAMLDALRVLIKQVPSKPTHPILGTLLFKFSPTAVEIKAFDLRSLASVKIPYQGEQPVDFCLGYPASFSKLISLMGDQSFSMEVDQVEGADLVLSTVTVSDSSGSYHFPVSDVEEYPDDKMDIRGKAKDEGYTLEFNGLFSQAFGVVSSRISEDMTKLVLTNLNIIINNESDVQLNGTDGHTLASFSVPIMSLETEQDITPPEDRSEEYRIYNFSIDPSNLPEALSTGDHIKLYVSNGCFNIETFYEGKDDELKQTPYFFAGRVADTPYAQIDQLIPKEFDHSFIVPVSKLMNALNKIDLFAGEKRVVILKASEDGHILVNSGESDLGSGSSKIIISGNGELKIDIAFNLKYLIDIVGSLQKFGAESLQFEIVGQVNPVVISPVRLAGISNGLSLIMPIQIRN